jgi:hypothetical protein
VFPLVFRHAFNGQNFATPRMGEQMLSGFPLAPCAPLDGLHDTRREPPDMPVDRTPGNGGPVQGMGGSTSRNFCRHLPRLQEGFSRLSRDGRPGGRLPACAWRDLAWSWYARRNASLLHYGTAFASSTLLYPPSHRSSLRRCYLFRRPTGLPCFVCRTVDRVGGASTPVTPDVHDG